MENHYRRCWDCGAINLHSDNIAPEVCCKRCRSQDTRLIKMKPCPFCGTPGTLERSASSLIGEYFSVGCLTGKCFGNVNAKGMAFPVEQVMGEVSAWNKRAE